MTDNYWQDNYQLHYSKEINGNLSANAALHYTHGQGYYENLVQNSKFSSFNLPNAISTRIPLPAQILLHKDG